ncbi:MAG: hypothetical protein QG657_4006 [Acidobacteriota bacterium]|nr:hypothetical protein [Acidobacteriota bacterium]
MPISSKSRPGPNLPDCSSRDPRTKLVDQMFSRWDKKDTPGCVIAIIKDGNIIYKRAYGMADLERDVALTTKSVFELGSMSKQFLAMCILLLIEEGKISLDDDIRKYIQEFPDYGYKITIKNLIYHTSGIRDYYELMSLAGMPVFNHYTAKQALDIIVRQKDLNFNPGDEHLYSNSGYFLLGIIVKRIVGELLGEYAQKNIFKPLNMDSTLYYDNFTRIVKNRAIGYFSKNDGGYGIGISLFDIVGDGGVLSTVEDLFRWDQNLFKNKLGRDPMKISQQYFTTGILNNGKELKYAFGLRIDTYKGFKLITHGGGWCGYQSQINHFPEHNFSIIYLSNLEDFEPMALINNITDIYLKSPLIIETQKAISHTSTKSKIVKFSETILKEKAGTYRNPQTGQIWRLLVKNKKLEVKTSYSSIFQMIPINNKEFQLLNASEDMQVIFFKSNKSKNKPKRLQIKIEGEEPNFYEYVLPISRSPLQLEEYTGNYYCNELESTYTIIIKNNKLVYLIKFLEESITLEPTFKDEFVDNDHVFRFTRNKNGLISGFNAWTDRIKPILFKKKLQLLN